MRQNRAVGFGKFVRHRVGQLNQPFTVAGQLVAPVDFFFFACDQIGRGYFVNLVAKQIELLFASRFYGVERGVFYKQRL